MKTHELFVPGIFHLIFLDHGRPRGTETTESEATHNRDYCSFLVGHRQQGGRVPTSYSILPRFSFSQASQEHPTCHQLLLASPLAAQKKGLARDLKKWKSTPLISPAPCNQAVRPQLKCAQDPSANIHGGRGVPEKCLPGYKSNCRTARGSHYTAGQQNLLATCYSVCGPQSQQQQQCLGTS